MLFFLSLGIMIASLAVLGYFVVRVYPQLLLLDVDSLSHVRSGRKKDAFIRKKAAVKSSEVYTKLGSALTPFGRMWTKIQLSFRRFFRMVEKRAHADQLVDEKNISKEERAQRKETARRLVQQAEQDVSSEDYPTAEKKYLAAIKQDARSIDAYKGLAKVYYAQGQIAETVETYTFILQLNPQDEEVYLHLGELAEEAGKMQEAVEYYQEAVLINPENPARFAKIFDLLFSIEEYETALEAIEQALAIEPQNPKYLDNFLETVIILGRKELAEEGYRQLRMINPENQKLQTFRQRIDKMD